MFISDSAEPLKRPDATGPCKTCTGYLHLCKDSLSIGHAQQPTYPVACVVAWTNSPLQYEPKRQPQLLGIFSDP